MIIMNRRSYTHLLIILTTLATLAACDNLTGKNDAFSDDLEEKLSMIQSEMGAIVATGDSIHMYLQKVESLSVSSGEDTADLDLSELKNALLVLARKQENLENAYGSLVTEYRHVLEAYRDGNMSESEARAQLDKISDRPVMLIKNHETLLEDLGQVHKQITNTEKLREEGARQRV
ncbi:MAG: hypothetical protein WBB45_02520 [Cyclobacteriaceae bacterium]